MSQATQIAAIKQAMFTYFTQTAGLSPEAVSDGSQRIENLDIDSLSMIEMLWDVEEKSGVHIDDVAALKDMTLDQIAEFIALQLPADVAAPSAAVVTAQAV